YDTVPLGLFLALHLAWLFPWSLYLPLAFREWIGAFRPNSALKAAAMPGELSPLGDGEGIVEASSGSRRRGVSLSQSDLSRQQRALLFCALWAALIILFFCFSTTQEYYTMPSYAAFALLLGFALSRAERAWPAGRRMLIGSQVGLTLLGVAILIVGL